MAAMEVSNSPVPETLPVNSPDSAQEIPSFRQDLATARKELNHIAKYLNVLLLAYNNAHQSSLAKHQKLVDRTSLKLLSGLTFYRNTARKLAIHCRTAQENQQNVSSQPPADYFKLERLQAELELLKASVNKLILHDYSVFNDLKLIAVDDLIKLRPDLLSDVHRCSEGDFRHRAFCAQIEFEQERRRKVMEDIDVLLKKKKSLQEEVKKRKDSLALVTKDVDETGKTLLESLAVKLNFSPADISRDISEIGPAILEAYHALQNREEKSATPADVDVEMVEVLETPLVTPEAVSTESPEEVIAREEGEASDEGESGNSPP